MNELHNYSAEWKKTARHPESSIPVTAPHSLKMYTLPNSSPSPPSQMLIQLLLAAVLKHPDRWVPQVHGRLTSLTLLIPSHKFRTRAISRDIDTATRFTGAATATVGMAGSGAGIGIVWEPHHWLYQELFFEARALLRHSGPSLLRGHRSFA